MDWCLYSYDCFCIYEEVVHCIFCHFTYIWLAKCIRRLKIDVYTVKLVKILQYCISHWIFTRMDWCLYSYDCFCIYEEVVHCIFCHFTYIWLAKCIRWLKIDVSLQLKILQYYSNYYWSMGKKSWQRASRSLRTQNNQIMTLVPRTYTMYCKRMKLLYSSFKSKSIENGIPSLHSLPSLQC